MEKDRIEGLKTSVALTQVGTAALQAGLRS